MRKIYNMENEVKKILTWVARDQDGQLFAYDYKPRRTCGMFIAGRVNGGIVRLSEKLLSEITWENSPRVIDFKGVD